MSSSDSQNASSSAQAGPSGTSGTSSKKPIVIVTIGMAGSGKTTFVQRINSFLHSRVTDPPSEGHRAPYILNLDPAVRNTPFDPNIDIRDTVNYQEVMKQCVYHCPHL